MFNRTPCTLDRVPSAGLPGKTIRRMVPFKELWSKRRGSKTTLTSVGGQAPGSHIELIMSLWEGGRPCKNP
jgi:hypothetical protein